MDFMLVWGLSYVKSCDCRNTQLVATVAGNGNELTSDEELFFFVSSREAINIV